MDETPYCMECTKEMNPGIDEDLNGDMGCVCAQCLAEQAHDFDAEPDVMFDRYGHVITTHLCPHCNGSLRAAFQDHVDFTVTSINEDDVEIDDSTKEIYHSSLIHIACNKCDKYWDSPHEFLQEHKS